MNQRGPEGQPQNQNGAIIEREKGELLIPQIKFSDLVSIHDAKKTLLPTLRMSALEGINSEFEKSIADFEERSRQETRKGLTRRKWSYIPQEAIVQGNELFERLKIERSQLPVIQTYSELRQTVNTLMGAVEGVHEEDKVFLRYFFPTPITDSTATDIWEAVLPQDETLKVLGGLLLRSKRAVPFRAHGKRHQTAESEEMKLAGPFLPPEMLEELAENIRLPVARMNENLRKAAELISSLKEYEPRKEREREELEEVSHLEFAVRVFNLSLSRILEDPSRPEAGIFAISLETALTRIEDRLKADIGSEKDHWWGSSINARTRAALSTPGKSFLNYLERERGYVLARPFEKDESTGKTWPTYAAKRVYN